jgi:hypothetical protein
MHREGGANPRLCVEALVAELPMESDRDAESAEDVEDGKQDEVDGMQGNAPEEPHRGEKADEWNNDRDERDHAARVGRARQHRGDCGGFLNCFLSGHRRQRSGRRCGQRMTPDTVHPRQQLGFPA